VRKKAIIALLIAVAAFVLFYFLIYSKNSGQQNVFRTTGIMESTEVEVSSKIPGRLAHIGFHEGDHVTKGELVAQIEPSEYDALRAQADAAVTTARKNLAAGYAALDNARAMRESAKSDAVRAEAQTRSADAALTQAEVDLVRADELFSKGVIPRSELDQATTNWDTYSAALDGAKAAKEAADSAAKAATAALNESGENVAALKARVAEAQSALNVADVRLSDTSINSPVDGVVDYRYLEDGETVAPGTPILNIINPADTWARADVDERYIGRIKVGQAARVTLEYMPDKVFEGTVYDIGREGDFATERDVTRGRQDIRTFRTRIRVKDPGGVLKNGMTVIVELPLRAN
jgi:multidrug resistance efflux pump